MRAQQLPLLAAPRGPSGFEAETRRRGGPYEVQGKRWRAERARRMAQGAVGSPTTAPIHPDVLAAINWPRRGK